MNTVTLASQLTIEAADSGAAPPFKLSAYNGGPLSVAKYDMPVVVDLSTLKNAPEVLANREHDKKAMVGHVTDVANDGRSLNLSGVLSYEGPDKERILASHKAGFPWKASIEVTPGHLEVLASGKTAVVNGQTFSGPLYIARDGILHGVAFVPRGADSSTQVTIAASAATDNGGSEMTFDEFVASLGLDAGQLDDAKRAMLQKAFDGMKPAAVAAAAVDLDEIEPDVKWSAEDIRAAHSDALDRLEEELLKVEDGAKHDIVATAKKAAINGLREIKATAAKQKWSSDRFAAQAAPIIAAAQLAIVRESRPSGPAIHSATRDVSGQVIEAALCQRLRLPNVEAQYDDKTLQTAHTLYRGRVSLQEMLIEAAAANGYQARPGERVNAGNIRQILARALPTVEAADGPSTYSLSGILSNVANKELAMGYMEEDQSWRSIARIATVNDFKQATTYRLLDNMEYELLAPSGAIKNGSISEESYTRQAKTYAKMFSLSRQAIINDDLSAFDDMRNRLGRGAARKLNRVFWTAFLANLGTSFTSTLGNYISGSTTNLGLDGVGLGLGVKAFRSLATSEGKKIGTPIGGEPVTLLTGQSNEANARQLFVATNLVGGSSTVPNANIYYNRFKPVICPFIEDTTLTGYTTTGWWLFRDPSVLSPMVVSFLDGQESPTVEMADADFDQLGISFRGYHDFGCDVAEPYAGIMSKGAA